MAIRRVARRGVKAGGDESVLHDPPDRPTHSGPIGTPKAAHDCDACAHENAPSNLRGVLTNKPPHTCGK